MKRSLPLISVLLLPACLVVPSEVPDLTTDLTNRPPKIIDSLTYPSPDETVVVVNGNCSSTLFSAYVTDPDRDTLYYRLFVNYYLVSTPYSEGVVPASLMDGNGRAQLRVQVANRENGHLLAAVSQGYTFDVVELIISDRPFLDNDYRGTTQEGQQDRYTWTIIRRDLGPCNE